VAFAFTFSIQLTKERARCIVAWPSGNSELTRPKITKIVQGDHPSERVKQEKGGETGE